MRQPKWTVRLAWRNSTGHEVWRVTRTVCALDEGAAYAKVLCSEWERNVHRMRESFGDNVRLGGADRRG